jgi:hypothetical protein
LFESKAIISWPCGATTLSIKTLSIMTFSVKTLSIMPLSMKTLSIKPLSMKTLSIMTLGILTLSIRSFNIITLSLKDLFATLIISESQHNNTESSDIMLSVVMLIVTFYLIC